MANHSLQNDHTNFYDRDGSAMGVTAHADTTPSDPFAITIVPIQGIVGLTVDDVRELKRLCDLALAWHEES